jgi:hypothetical protein
MVFVKRDIPASQTLVVWEATDIPKDKLLQVTNQINMAGMMTQFTLLMTYSHEVFEGLLDEANTTFDRLKDLGSRVSDLQATLPDIEATFDGEDMATLQRMNSTAGTRYLAANPEKQDHFQSASMPKPVRAVRDKCFPPPSLHLLDPFRAEDDRTPTLTKYSNPLFFLQQWAAEQQAKTDELRAERKKKRAERVARRAERDAQQQGAKPVRKLRKIRYDPQTGQRIVEEEDEVVTVPVTARGTQPVQTQQQQPAYQAPVAQQPAAVAAPVAPVSAPATTTTSSLPVALPPPAAEVHHAPAVPEKKPSKKDKSTSGKKDKKDKRPKEDAPLPPSHIPAPIDAPSHIPAPIPPTPNIPAPVAPIPAPVAAAPASAIPAPIGGGPAPPPPPPPPAAGPPPPPPPMAAGGPPPPPPPAMSGGGGDKSDLMAAIRGGSSLKKASEGGGGGGGGGSIEKPVDTRSNLMENIRMGLKLKSAGDRKVPEKSKDAGGAPSSVAEILARRIAIEPDSDDDVDDDNDDWSD